MCGSAAVYSSFFNLIAQLITKFRACDPGGTANQSCLTPESADNLNQEVTQFLNDFFDLDFFTVFEDNSQTCADILNAVDHNYANNQLFQVRLVQALLETVPLHEGLYQELVRRSSRAPLSALNSNADETHIHVLPFVSSPHIARLSGDSTATRAVRYAEELSATHHKVLGSYYYITDEELRDPDSRQSWTVNHLFLPVDAVVSRGQSHLQVAVCTVSRKDHLCPNYSVASTPDGYKQNVFQLNGLRDEALLHEAVSRSYGEACRAGADIMLFPELLGTPCMAELKNGFNPFFKALAKKACLEDGFLKCPSLIIAPSVWKDRHNTAFIYDGEGRLLCRQEKQYPFAYTEGGTHYNEDLSPDRTVSLLHIPGLGRVAVTICMDHLQYNYRSNVLIQGLMSTFLFCPSFSTGLKNFVLSGGAGDEFGCYTIWGNTCAAAPSMRRKPPLKQLGLVSVPSPTHNSMLWLEPACDGSCACGCTFLASIPLTELAGNEDGMVSLSCRQEIN